MTVPQTLPAALLAAEEAYGDRVALVDGDVTLTYGDLAERVRQAAGVYAGHGVGPGDRVCLWAPNTWDWVVAALAVSWSGATLVPLNTRYTGHEAVEVVDRTSARLVVVADGFLGRSYADDLRAAAEESGTPLEASVLVLAEGWLAGASRLAEPAAVHPDDIADILFTSGTTGRSKGVLSAHRQTVAAGEVWGRTVELTGDDRYLIVNPFFHSFGYKAGMVACLLRGTTMYPLATFDVAATLSLVERERITVLPGAPAIFHSLFAAPELAATELSSLRLAVTGAASVPVALVERMQKELSFDTVLTAFGMTECVVATMCRPGDADETVAATCGRAVAGLELRIVDPETGEVRAGGEAGELQLRGPMVMQGYLDDPEATAEAIDADGWLHTGDVGVVDERGYLRITDRLKDMYISGGFNVYPAEVEQALARLDGVAEAAVVGVPDERMGEVGRAYVVRTPGADLTADDVIAFARERIANFKVPREVEFVDALPRNLSGKVLKNELRSSR